MPAKRGQRSSRSYAEKADAEEKEDAEENDEPATEQPGSRRAPGDMTAATAAKEGMEQIAAVTNKTPEGVTSVEPSDNGWVVEVEVLEDRHIPSSSDILGLYEVEIDLDGALMSYRRTRRYSRGRGDGSGGEGS